MSFNVVTLEISMKFAKKWHQTVIKNWFFHEIMGQWGHTPSRNWRIRTFKGTIVGVKCIEMYWYRTGILWKTDIFMKHWGILGVRWGFVGVKLVKSGLPWSSLIFVHCGCKFNYFWSNREIWKKMMPNLTMLWKIDMGKFAIFDMPRGCN